MENNPIVNKTRKRIPLDMEPVYKSLIISDKKLRMPDILNRGGIPYQLSGMSPRILKGRTWWDKVRKKAYESTDYNCIACGIHESKAKYHQRLEAHECYKYDYINYIAEVEKIIPLCHACHVFLHTGRLMFIYQDGLIPKERVSEIILHGLNVLKNTSTPILKSPPLLYLAEKMNIDISGFNIIDKQRSKPNKKELNRFEKCGGWKLRIGEEIYMGKTDEQLEKEYTI